MWRGDWMAGMGSAERHVLPLALSIHLLVLTVVAVPAIGGSHTDRLIERLGNTQDDAKRIELLKEIVSPLRRSAPSRAREFAREGEALARAAGRPRDVAHFLNAVASTYLVESNYEQAELIYEEGLHACEGDRDCEIPLSVHIALMHQMQGKYDIAFRRNYDAYEYCRNLPKIIAHTNKTDCDTAIGVVTQNIGFIHARLGRTEDALAFFERSLEYETKTGRNIGPTLVGIAGVKAELGHYTEALETLLRARPLLVSMSNDWLLGMSHEIEGTICYQQGRFEDALVQFQRSLDLAKKLDRKEEIAKSRLGLARAHMALGADDRAETHLATALRLSQAADFPQDTRSAILDTAAARAERHKNLAQAAAYYRARSELVTEAFSDRLARAIAIARTELDVERQSFELTRLQQNNAIRELELEKREAWLFGGIVIAVILATLCGLLFRNLALQRRTNAALEEKRQLLANAVEDRTWLLKEMNHRINNNLQVIFSMLETQEARLKKAGQDSVDGLSLIRDISNRIQTIALIHKQLYRVDRPDRIDMADQMKGLVQHFRNLTEDTVKVNVVSDSVRVDIDTALTLSLITCEMVSNAIEHAFPKGTKGKVNIRFEAEDDQTYRLCVEDTGFGTPEDLQSRKSASMGLDLIERMASKLEGTLTCETNTPHGIRWQLAVPLTAQ